MRRNLKVEIDMDMGTEIISSARFPSHFRNCVILDRDLKVQIV